MGRPSTTKKITLSNIFQKSMELQLVLLLLSLQVVTVVTSTSSPAPYELIIRRTFTTELTLTREVVLTCREGVSADELNVETVTFWLNRSSNNQDLRDRKDFGIVEVTRVGCCSIKFNLSPNLEGYYTCGRSSRNGSVHESLPVTLISLQTSAPDRANVHTNFIAISGGTAILNCPDKPGALLQYYWVIWMKNNTMIVRFSDSEGFWSTDPRYNIDRSTFALIISSVNLNDSGKGYQCEVYVRNPYNGDNHQLRPHNDLITLDIYDVFECQSGMHNCKSSEHQICVNTDGSYICECGQGYNNVSGVCEDVDECLHQLLNNCTYMCVNTIGSYYCICEFWYSLEADGKSCVVSAGKIAGITVGLLIILLVSPLIVLLGVYTPSHWHQMKQFVANIKSPPATRSKADSPVIINEEKITFPVQSSCKLNIPEQLVIHSTNLELLNVIGQGDFGIVYKGYIITRNIHSGEIVKDIVAMKTLKGFYDDMVIREMLEECNKMCNLNHPNVLSLTGVCLDGGTAPYIVMPFMANGSLLPYLRKHRHELIIPTGHEQDGMTVLRRLMDMCIQVVKGMEYLAENGIVHRDLAARNCMISFNFVIKVGDFGLAVTLGAKNYFRQDKDTMIKLPMRWLAPESIHNFLFSEKSDVWAFGVTCWEIFSGGMLPYAGINAVDIPDQIQMGVLLKKPSNEACSDKMYSFMRDCWALQPESRPTFADLAKQLSAYLESMASYLKLIYFDTELYLGVGIKSGSDQEQSNMDMTQTETVL